MPSSLTPWNSEALFHGVKEEGIIAEHVYPEEHSEDVAAPRKMPYGGGRHAAGPKKNKLPEG